MIQPILDRVFVRRLTKESKSTILIPERYRQAERTGEVLALGQFVVIGGLRIPLDEIIQVGDVVLFGEYAAEKFEEDEKLVLLRIQDIRGKVPPKSDMEVIGTKYVPEEQHGGES